MHAFALIPPAEPSRIFSALRETLDPEHAATTIPHITVKQPFVIAGGEFETLLPALRAICARLGPMPVELVEAGVFESEQFGSVLHLRAARTRALDALHEALLRAVEEAGGITQGLTVEREEHIFFPHLTLAQGLQSERAREALAALSLPLPIRFEASALVIGVQGDDQIWRRPHTLALPCS